MTIFNDAPVGVTAGVKWPGNAKPTNRFGWWTAVGRGGVEPPTFRFSGIVFSQLSEGASPVRAVIVQRLNAS